ncbi:MAG: acetylxylan esterase, partial [Leptospiraceae bacterium]|nr:acetylxylan esterase [Leptospiraceae bacterium]
MKASFDDCFQTFPSIQSPPDLNRFWQKGMTALKRVNVDPRSRLVLSRSLGRESLSEVNFAGLDNHRLHGLFTVPRRRGKLPAVIAFHDYHEQIDGSGHISGEGLALLTVQLRGHETEFFSHSAGSDLELREKQLCADAGLADAEASYLYRAYLDAVRCVDFLRLQKSIDMQRIGIIGRGFGAALAVFAATQMSENVRALVLERPSFLWLQAWLEESTSDLAQEIKHLVSRNTRLYTRSKKNLPLFDPLNWTEQLKPEVMAAVSLEDDWNPPRPAFGFFNRLKAEKSMQLSPDEESYPTASEQRAR